jgi:hypothetical protein
MSQNTKIRVGEELVSINGYPQNSGEEIPEAYLPFMSEGEADLCVRFQRGQPDIRDQQKRFESHPIWTLYHSNGSRIIKIYEKMPGQERILVFPSALDSADFYFPCDTDIAVDPFSGPTLELLMINYLAQGRGVIIHGCGLEKDREGILFIGESGAGKSTMANLWNAEGGIQILSDDRVIVRKKGNGFWMFGTPWHGEAHYVSPRAVKLKKMFFLRHAEKHEAQPLNTATTVQKLLQCSFPPFWDARGMEFALELFCQLAAMVPCFEFSFTPDNSAIDYLKLSGIRYRV